MQSFCLDPQFLEGGMMKSGNTSINSRASRLLIVMSLLTCVWVLGGFAALMAGSMDSLSFTAQGHVLTIWLMVTFLFVAGVYLALAWMSKVRLAPWIIVILLVVLEVFLGISYFNW
jgi:hypothetical protein